MNTKSINIAFTIKRKNVRLNIRSNIISQLPADATDMKDLIWHGNATPSIVCRALLYIDQYE